MSAVVRRHLDDAGLLDLAGADKAIDFVLLEKKGDAIHVGRDGIVLVLHHAFEIEPGLVDDDTKARERVIRLGKFFRRREQRLRGNAADVETRAAEGLVLFDDGDFQAQLRGAYGADITAGTCADDDEIISHERAFD